MKEEQGSSAEKKTNFEAEDLEAIIGYYQSNPTLWNHNLTDYRDRIKSKKYLNPVVQDLMIHIFPTGNISEVWVLWKLKVMSTTHSTIWVRSADYHLRKKIGMCHRRLKCQSRTLENESHCSVTKLFIFAFIERSVCGNGFRFGSSRFYRVQIPGMTVADSLMQCETNE